MPAFSCPSCDHAPVDVVEFTDDARMRLHCPGCDHAWIHPPAVPVPATGGAASSAGSSTAWSTASTGRATSTAPRARRAPVGRQQPLTREQALARFPTEDDLTDDARARLVDLKGRFLRTHPRPDERVDEYFRFYQLVFTAEGLQHALPSDLKSFANSTIGAHPGNMSVFNATWNKLGDRDAAERVRAVVEHLLRGDADDPHIEDRMQTLIEPGGLGMNGFRESLLTRVLCVVFPERFLPILTYTTPAGGKKEIAAAVFDLDLPAPKATSWTTGRLAFWSNDLLLRLCGSGFVDVAHASEFLWWAKDQPRS